MTSETPVIESAIWSGATAPPTPGTSSPCVWNGALLRVLRPQRRGQDDDDQVPAELLRPTSGTVKVFCLDPAITKST